MTHNWNAENRLVVGREVKPGQKIQLAIFGINGPISNPPTNYIYMRYAKLEFHKVSGSPVAVTPQEVNVEVVRTRSRHRRHRSRQSENFQIGRRLPVY